MAARIERPREDGVNVHCLGHAMWLVDANGLRILFDPLLEDLHHGGVFEVVPHRTLDVEALRPDFILVSHRHPDHFDVPSLRRLAQIDPDTVIVTPDPLIAEVAAKVGFHDIRELGPNMEVELQGARIITTPSEGAIDPEWGVIIDDGTFKIWNQVDTEPREMPSGVIDLALVRWQPLLEVEAMLGERFGFPFERYARELTRAKALGARAVVPASAGARHAAPFDAMNRLVYPVTEDRFRADLAKLGVVSHPAVTGTCFRVGEEITTERSPLVEVHEIPETRDFRPFEIPPIVDPNLADRSRAAMMTAIDHWVTAVLAPAVTPELRHSLEVVLPNENVSYTLHRGTVVRAHDPEWDLRCAVAGSLLLDVIEGKRHWGDLLLGGALRAASRAYEIEANGLEVKNVQPLFVYEAVSYEASVRHALQTMYS